MLAACAPARSPRAIGDSLCKDLASGDYYAATRDARELMRDTQLYTNNDALMTFAVWVASQPCAKDVEISPFEIYTLPAIREIGFVVERDGERKVCVADFSMGAPWTVTFHACEPL